MAELGEHGYHPSASVAHAEEIVGTDRAHSATEQSYLTQLRQLLTTHFDAEELHSLCFDLGVDYDDLRGEGKANKARELVAYLDRRGRIPDLVAQCSQLRPQVSWTFTFAATPTAAPGPEYSRPVSHGLNALAEFIKLPQVRNAVATFRASFKAASEQIDILGDYKQLHDLLHNLQYQCYNPIAQEAKRFPDDETALDDLTDYDRTLQQIVRDAKEVAHRSTLATAETAWIQDLVKAHEALSGAIRNMDAPLLKKAIWWLNQVLALQPSQINTRLNAAARTLPLTDLVNAMARVSDHLAPLELDAEQVSQFEAGVDALVSLNQRLTTLRDNHDKWQGLDLRLRLITANLEQDLDMLLMTWPDVKAMSESLCSSSTDECVTSFSQDGANLDSAITAGNPADIRRRFRRYSRQAGTCFYQVDVNLKRLCDDLRKVSDPLTLVVRMIE